jgi:glycosyltransferase involved in cell wall biosynthesis
VYAGITLAYRGLDRLLEALALIKELPVRAVLGGAGETRGAVRDQALGIAEPVAFTGTFAHRDMPRYLAAADLI